MGDEENCGWETMVEPEFENIVRAVEMDRIYTSLTDLQGVTK
jgi:hypothetical protein